MTDSRSTERTFRFGSWRLPVWATIFAAGAVVFMLALSLWQVQRLQWKEGLIAERQARLAEPAAELPSTINDPDDWAFRRVTATGTFNHDRETFLGARSLRGNVGYHVVTPLIRADSTAVLVDRGWIPLNRRDPATRADGLEEGVVAITGVGRATGQRNWLTPEDSPEEDFWFVVDIAAIGQHMGLDRVLPVYVEIDAGPPGEMPIGGQTRAVLPNDHLQYAITWFCLAVALMVIYVIYVRRMNRP